MSRSFWVTAIAGAIVAAAGCAPRHVRTDPATLHAGKLFEWAFTVVDAYSEGPVRAEEFYALGVEGMRRYARERGRDAGAADTTMARLDADETRTRFYRRFGDFTREAGLPADSLAIAAATFALYTIEPRSVWYDARTAGLVASTAEAAGGVRVFPLVGGPAYRAGLRSGDVVVSIDGVATRGIRTADFVERARGPKGTACVLEYVRNDGDPPVTVTVTRGYPPRTTPELNPQFVRAGVAFVRIRDVGRHTAEDLASALRQLGREQPVHSLILDLREADGTDPRDACAVADLFIAHGRLGSLDWFRGDTLSIDATAGEQAAGCPMIVLVGPGTACGAELIAGALRESGRATLLGRRTAGAGLAYRGLRAGDHVIRLPVGTYLLPSGKPFQGAGIEPDVPFDGEGRDALDAALERLSS